MALNGVAWPVGNPKTLKVAFTTEEQMKAYKEVKLFSQLMMNLFSFEPCFRLQMEF